MARTKRSAEKESFWRWVFEEQQRSGLSMRAFSLREGISEASFYTWRREIKRRDAENAEQSGDEETGNAGPSVELQQLIPVDVVDAKPTSLPRYDKPSLLEIITPTGFTLRFDQHVEAHQINSLLSTIMTQRGGGQAC